MGADFEGEICPKMGFGPGCESVSTVYDAPDIAGMVASLTEDEPRLASERTSHQVLG